MILKLEKSETQNDIEIIIKYPQENKTVKRLVTLFNSVDMQINCHSDDELVIVNASDVWYIESIDKKTIIFCEKGNYLVKDKLYQIYEKLKSVGFVRISKYCILNINKLEKVKTLENSHIEAILSNGSKLYITRKYLPDIKQALQENL